MNGNVGCCVFRPAFGCCVHPKAGGNTFFSCFQPFLFILNLLYSFHAWNQEKIKYFFSDLGYSLKLVDMQELVDSLRGYLEFVFFWLIFYFFNLNSSLNWERWIIGQYLKEKIFQISCVWQKKNIAKHWTSPIKTVLFLKKLSSNSNNLNNAEKYRTLEVEERVSPFLSCLSKAII